MTTTTGYIVCTMAVSPSATAETMRSHMRSVVAIVRVKCTRIRFGGKRLCYHLFDIGRLLLKNTTQPYDTGRLS